MKLEEKHARKETNITAVDLYNNNNFFRRQSWSKRLQIKAEPDGRFFESSPKLKGTLIKRVNNWLFSVTEHYNLTVLS